MNSVTYDADVATANLRATGRQHRPSPPRADGDEESGLIRIIYAAFDEPSSCDDKY